MDGLEEKKTRRGWVNEAFEWVQTLLYAVLAVVLIFTFVCRTIVVGGDSMNPNLHDGDTLLSSRLFYTPQFGDIVVITQPNTQEKTLIKRVIAVGGQTVEVDLERNAVLVDGEEVDNSFIAEPMTQAYNMDGPVTVPEGYVFVMGDNRNHSFDSRTDGLGLVDVNYIVGRVVWGLSPFGAI